MLQCAQARQMLGSNQDPPCGPWTVVPTLCQVWSGAIVVNTLHIGVQGKYLLLIKVKNLYQLTQNILQQIRACTFSLCCIQRKQKFDILILRSQVELVPFV